MVNLNIEELNPKEGFQPTNASDLQTFADNSVDEIQSEDYVHIVDNFIGFIEELYRILKPGGKAVIFTPYCTSTRAYQDIRTKRQLNEGTFLAFNKDWREKNMKGFEIKTDFDVGYGYILDPEFDTRSDIAKAYATKFYNNVVLAFQIILIKK